MNKLFDIACNFTSNRFDDDLDKVIANAIDKNVDKFLLQIYHQHSMDEDQSCKILYLETCSPNHAYSHYILSLLMVNKIFQHQQQLLYELHHQCHP